MVVTISHQAGDPYEHVLGDLRRRRDELDNAIRLLESVRTPLVAQAPKPAAIVGLPIPAPTEVKSPASGPYAGLSISDAGRRVLLATLSPEKTQMHVSEIHAALVDSGMTFSSPDPLNIVGSVLSRRANTIGDVVRVGRGMWSLPDGAPTRTLTVGEMAAEKLMDHLSDDGEKDDLEAERDPAHDL